MAKKLEERWMRESKDGKGARIIRVRKKKEGSKAIKNDKDNSK